jgi:hypothetical protein
MLSDGFDNRGVPVYPKLVEVDSRVRNHSGRCGSAVYILWDRTMVYM